MEITSLKRQKNIHNSRVNVYIDEEFSFACYETDILNFNLYRGKKITSQEIAEIQKSDGEKKVYHKALKYLSLRSHSSKELEKKLLSKNYSPQDVENMLNRLEEEGYVNDEDFAKSWVRERKLLRPKSRKALNYELRNKGVPENIIKKSLEEFSEEEEREQAFTEVEKKFLNAKKNIEKNKVYEFLSRKGYPYEIVKDVIKKIGI